MQPIDSGCVCVCVVCACACVCCQGDKAVDFQRHRPSKRKARLFVPDACINAASLRTRISFSAAFHRRTISTCYTHTHADVRTGTVQWPVLNLLSHSWEDWVKTKTHFLWLLGPFKGNPTSQWLQYTVVRRPPMHVDAAFMLYGCC